MKNEKTLEVKEMIELLRKQNHDILNGFQVVSGYLQLGQLDQGLNYLKKIAEALCHQRELLRWEYLSTILLLMRLKLEIAQSGVNLIVKSTTNLKNLSISEESLNEFLLNMMNLFRENAAQEERELVLKVDEGENFYFFEFGPCFISLDENFRERFLKKVTEIVKKSDALCDLLDNCLICKLPKICSDGS